MKTVLDFKKYKTESKKISMVTCYDNWSAKILANTPVDCLLVGDSVSMVVHGFDSTVHATLDMMVAHTQAVARAQTGKLIVSDLPFLEHRKGQNRMMKAVDALMKAGAQALKIETAPGQEGLVRYVIESGVPVLGHIGLTPQYVNQLGGYKVQGKTQESFNAIFDQAVELEKAGCHAIILECVPDSLAKKITENIDTATVGIGAGSDVDGQVLVLQDLLGFNQDFHPRFVRRFAEGTDWMHQAIHQYTESIANHSFPTEEESFR